MTEFLYYTFLYQNYLGNNEISFNKVKRLLSNTISEYQDVSYAMTPFYDLLKLGLIDCVGSSNYSLTKSSIFVSSSTNFSLGVNLPNSILILYKDKVLNTNLGLTIFKKNDWRELSCETEIITFNLNVFKEKTCDIRHVVKNWQSIPEEELGKHLSLERYDFALNKWFKTNLFEGEYSIFKKYTINEYYYEYVFKLANKFYLIHLDESEKIRMLILNKANKNLIKFDQEVNKVILKPYFNYPNYIYKSLFMTHVLNTGCFPQYKFSVNRKQFLLLVKSLKLNYEML